MLLTEHGDCIFSAGEEIAVGWLSEYRLKMDFEEVSRLLCEIDAFGSEHLYHTIEHSDERGKVRRLRIPNSHLKKVQETINKRMFSYLSHWNFHCPGSFGFAGGSTYEAVKVHQNNKSFFCFDLKDAFYQMTYERVAESLRSDYHWRGGSIWQLRGDSWRVSQYIAMLCTYTSRDGFHGQQTGRSFLPQGAPTSPKLFEKCMASTDKYMLELAKRVGGKYSRYADNCIMSMPTNEFPRKLLKAILREMSEDQNIEVHKIKVVERGANCRSLGYNLSNGEILNNREYKKKLRKSIYHLNWLLEHGGSEIEILDAHSRVCGLGGNGVFETLPSSLVTAYQDSLLAVTKWRTL